MAYLYSSTATVIALIVAAASLVVDARPQASSSSGRRQRVVHGDVIIGSADDEEVGPLTNLEDHFTPEEIRLMQVAMIRQQILDNLNVRVPPNVSRAEMGRLVPEPVVRKIAYDEEMADEARHFASSNDRFHSNTKEKIILAQISNQCPFKPHSTCLEVTIPAELDPSSVSAVLLIVYWRPGDDRPKKNILDVYEINEGSPKPRTHYGRHPLITRHGWLMMDLSAAAGDWMNQPHAQTRLLQISCRSCSGSTPIIETRQSGRTPYVSIEYIEHTKERRSKRHAHGGRCIGNCCLKPLEVNFNDMDYIVGPKEFNINRCEGTCEIRMNSPFLPPDLRQQLIYRHAAASKVLHLCCVPTEYVPREIVYMDSEGDIIRDTLVNVDASLCGCR